MSAALQKMREALDAARQELDDQSRRIYSLDHIIVQAGSKLGELGRTDSSGCFVGSSIDRAALPTHVEMLRGAFLEVFQELSSTVNDPAHAFYAGVVRDRYRPLVETLRSAKR